jgi:hypothetical protein
MFVRSLVFLYSSITIIGVPNVSLRWEGFVWPLAQGSRPRRDACWLHNWSSGERIISATAEWAHLRVTDCFPLLYLFSHKHLLFDCFGNSSELFVTLHTFPGEFKFPSQKTRVKHRFLFKVKHWTFNCPRHEAKASQRHIRVIVLTIHSYFPPQVKTFNFSFFWPTIPK